MCANGLVEEIRGEDGQFGLVDQADPGVRAAQHGHQALAVVAVGAGVGHGVDQVVDDVGHALALGGEDGLVPLCAPRRLRVAEPLPCRVQQRQVGHRPGLRVGALEPSYVVGAQPGSAHPQIGGHRPQVPHQVGRLQQRPGALEGPDELLVLS